MLTDEAERVEEQREEWTKHGKEMLREGKVAICVIRVFLSMKHLALVNGELTIFLVGFGGSG